MAANRSFLGKVFSKRRFTKAQKKDFTARLKQIDWNDANAIKDYLATQNNKNKGLILEQFEPNETSLLHWACSLGPSTGVEVVRFLIEQGADK